MRRSGGTRDPSAIRKASWRTLCLNWKDRSIMNAPEPIDRTVPEGTGNRVLQGLRCWWRRPSADEYLAAATDTADLERRIRVLERASGGPAFVTFNH